MIVLAFDSVAKVASCAVCKDERPLAIYSIDNGLTQSELLLPMAEDILKSLKLTFDDVDAFAVSTGPGSFTGVRIGVSLVKGLAFGKGKAVIGVSALQALAENLSGISALVVPCMDARRGQVYTAVFRSDKDGLTRLTEDMAISLRELAEILKGYSEEDIYLCGDGYNVAREALVESGIKLCRTPSLLINENAYSVAVSAIKKYNEGGAVSDIEIAPTYLRVPQAERERLEKENNEKGTK